MEPATISAPTPMTYYDIGKLLEKMAKLIRNAPDAIITELGEIERGGVRELVATAETTFTKLREVQTKIDAQVEKAVALSDANWERVKKARDTFAARMERLDLPEVKVPYDIEKLVDLAERFASLSDKQWQRVLDLAKAFRGEE